MSGLPNVLGLGADDNRFALVVSGKVRFNRSGRASVPAGWRHVDIGLRPSDLPFYGVEGTPLCFANLMSYRPGCSSRPSDPTTRSRGRCGSTSTGRSARPHGSPGSCSTSPAQRPSCMRKSAAPAEILLTQDSYRPGEHHTNQGNDRAPRGMVAEPNGSTRRARSPTPPRRQRGSGTTLRAREGRRRRIWRRDARGHRRSRLPWRGTCSR
jgi:hypothetical protein